MTPSIKMPRSHRAAKLIRPKTQPQQTVTAHHMCTLWKQSWQIIDCWLLEDKHRLVFALHCSAVSCHRPQNPGPPQTKQVPFWPNNDLIVVDHTASCLVWSSLFLFQTFAATARPWLSNSTFPLNAHDVIYRHFQSRLPIPSKPFYKVSLFFIFILYSYSNFL